MVIVEPEILQNNRSVGPETPLKDGAEIKCKKAGTVREAIAGLYDIDINEFNNDFISCTQNGETKYIPVEKYLILHRGKPVDLDIQLKEGMELEVEEFDKDEITVRNVVNNNSSNGITITFNNSKLSIPVRTRIICNGKELQEDRKLENGDEIKYKKGSVKVKHVFEHINYRVSPFFNKFRMTVNGKEAELDDVINDGDQLQLDYDKENKYINRG
ncbi:MAG: hypothetical protein ACOCQH_01270, partial [Halanaerobiales bacterium]